MASFRPMGGQRQPDTATAAAIAILVPTRLATGFFHINLNESESQPRAGLGRCLERFKNACPLFLGQLLTAVRHNQLNSLAHRLHGAVASAIATSAVLGIRAEIYNGRSPL